MNRRNFFLRGGMAAGTFGAGALTANLAPTRALATEPSDSTPADRLAAQYRQAQRWAGRPAADWVKPREGVDHNVVVVGGGQTGLGIAYGLRRNGIGRVAIIDRAEPGQAGIWRTIARMHQLRSPKSMPGPDYGNPCLGFRAWFETLNGPAAFDALERIPRLAWADYLSWYEQATDAGVRYGTRLLAIEPAGDFLRLHLDVHGAQRTETTRKLVLANGLKGAGGAHVPEILRQLPADRWSHTDSPLDFRPFAGKSIAIIGAGASAFDAAATALEAGAAQVHLYSRRTYINYPVPGVGGPPGPPGDRGHAMQLELLGELPDEVRWRDWHMRENEVTSVPMDSIARAVRQQNFHLHLRTEWTSAVAGPQGVTARIGGRSRRFDHVIAGSGYRVDLGAQEELALIHENVALWGERYRPPASEQNPAMERYPYLGAGFQFLARDDAGHAYLRNIHCFNIAASASFGTLTGDIASMRQQPLLVSAIARDFFLEDVDLAQSRRYGATAAIPPNPEPYQKAVSST